ncbi:MAG: hypothetical protein ABSE68_03255 [Minisyncoccia bacterium]
MRNINKVLLIVAIALLLALVGILVWQNWFSQPSYYAVYLRTGDLYFGQLSRFPSFGLSRVYLLQVNSQNQQNPVNVQKFSNVFWGPEDFIKINRDDVVWYTKLRSDSQLLRLIESNPELTSPQTNANQGAQQPAAKDTQENAK